MLILYSDDLTITGYQISRKQPQRRTSKRRSIWTIRSRRWLRLLTETNGVLTLPDNLPELGRTKRRADLATETRAERDRQLQELDKVVEPAALGTNWTAGRQSRLTQTGWHCWTRSKRDPRGHPRPEGAGDKGACYLLTASPLSQGTIVLSPVVPSLY